MTQVLILYKFLIVINFKFSYTIRILLEFFYT